MYALLNAKTTAGPSKPFLWPSCNIVRPHVEQNGGCIKLPEDVIEFPSSELQRKEFCAGYNLLGSNCEHFATLCKTGWAFSMQSILLKAKVDAFLTKVRAVFSGAAFNK